MGTGDLCRVPPVAVDTGEPGKGQGGDPVGIEEGSCGYRSRGVSIRGTFDLSRNPGYKTGGGGGGSDPPEGGSGIQNSGTGPTASSGYN